MLPSPSRRLFANPITALVIAASLLACKKAATVETDPGSAAAANAEGPAPGGSAQGEASAQPQGERYSASLSSTTLVRGVETTVFLHVTPGAGLKINKDYPWKVQWQTPEGATIGQSVVDKAQMELSDELARIPVSLRTERPGSIPLKAVASLSVCNEDRCDILRDEPLGLEVQSIDLVVPAGP